jgi:hypothetical protein
MTTVEKDIRNDLARLKGPLIDWQFLSEEEVKIKMPDRTVSLHASEFWHAIRISSDTGAVIESIRADFGLSTSEELE